MGYRNWRQRWCKTEGNKVFGKEKIDKNPIFSTSFGSVTFTRAKYRIFVSFSFLSNKGFWKRKMRQKSYI